MWDYRRRIVELINGKARCGPVACHELGTLLGRDYIVDIVECAAATFINNVEQPKWPGAAVAQDELRDRAAKLVIIGGKRLLRGPVLDYCGPQNTRIDNGLAPAVGASWIHGMSGIAKQHHRAVPPGGHGIAVDHWVFKDAIRLLDQAGTSSQSQIQSVK